MQWDGQTEGWSEGGSRNEEQDKEERERDSPFRRAEIHRCRFNVKGELHQMQNIVVIYVSGLMCVWM